jgi:hypothetical protein
MRLGIRMSIGNTYLGIPDKTMPLPWVFSSTGKKLYQLQICKDCSGYYAVECPCFIKNNPFKKTPETRIWLIWVALAITWIAGIILTSSYKSVFWPIYWILGEFDN